MRGAVAVVAVERALRGLDAGLVERVDAGLVERVDAGLVERVLRGILERFVDNNGSAVGVGHATFEDARGPIARLLRCGQ